MEWISVKQNPPKDIKKCLAIFCSEKDVIYNCAARGWFRDTIYACRLDKDRFIIESHGPELPATHWMPLPSPPTSSSQADPLAKE